MARPGKQRRICHRPLFSRFGPLGKAADPDPVIMSLEEYESIRLIDLEECDQAQAAEIMGISRSGLAAIYKNARNKIARSLVFGETLSIAGGCYRLCCGEAGALCRAYCQSFAFERKQEQRKDKHMIIAVTYDETTGEIFQHFGRTEAFKLYEVEDGKVKSSRVAGTNGQGHGALTGVLRDDHADVLICGGIGGGARMALESVGIQLFPGCTGSADDAVNDFLAGKLSFDPNGHCDHHDHGEEHGCGSEGHGCCH